MRAAGAVRRLLAVALDRDRHVALAVEEPVHGLGPVPARDDHGRGAERVDALGEILPARPRPSTGRPASTQASCEVRRDDGGEREQTVDERADGVVLEELGAGGGDHDRVDDERHRSRLQVAGHRLDRRRAEEHPRLGRVDADVVEDRVELRADELGRKLVDGRDLGRVLRRQRDERRRPVAAERGEGLQVGLDPRSAAGVGGRDRETARNRHGLRLVEPPRRFVFTSGVATVHVSLLDRRPDSMRPSGAPARSWRSASCTEARSSCPSGPTIGVLLIVVGVARSCWPRHLVSRDRGLPRGDAARAGRRSPRRRRRLGADVAVEAGRWSDLLDAEEVVFQSEIPAARAAGRSAPGRSPPPAGRGARAPWPAASSTPTRPRPSRRPSEAST